MDRFDVCLPRVLKSEGGWSDRPLSADPGGPTMWGVTQGTYDRWRRSKGLPQRSVRNIEDAEARAIYREWFWRAGGEGLPAGLDYAVFDYGVNSGPGQAVRALQRALMVKADGLIGPETLAAANNVKDVDALLQVYCDGRLSFMRGLKNWNANKNGWTRRVRHVLSTAQAEARGSVGDYLPEAAAPGKADARDTSAARVVKEAATNPAAIAATAGAVLGPLAPLATGTGGPLPWAIAAVLVIVAVTGAVLLLRRREA